MRIQLNGDWVDCDRNINLATFVHHLPFHSDALAVAVNHRVVPKAQWPDYVIKQGDHIDAFTLVAGG